MTVKELIDRLGKIKNKDLDVVFVEAGFVHYVDVVEHGYIQYGEDKWLFTAGTTKADIDDFKCEGAEEAILLASD